MARSAISRVAFLLALSAVSTRADSVLEIIGQAKKFRDGTVQLFEGAEKSLRADGHVAKADAVAKWNNDWMSILGISTGLTGLAKDFVVGYLGRSEYHSQNKYLLDALGHTGRAIRQEVGKTAGDQDIQLVKMPVVRVCDEGRKLFAEGGALNNMLSDLYTILQDDKSVEHLGKEIKDLTEAFQWLTGAPPVSDKDLAALDDDDDDEDL